MSNAEDSLATLPPLSEKDFLRQVVELAEIRGWQWLHLRPGMTRDSWRTPISGPLGKGWPDLVLTRERDHRMIFAEVKTDDGRLSLAQEGLLAHLADTVDGWQRMDGEAPVSIHVWRPRFWEHIEAALR